MSYAIRLVILLMTPLIVWAQASPQPESKKPPLRGYFLTDSIEVGRPFQYSLTYRHAAGTDVLFPDTAQHFAPYRVLKMAVFATQTTGSGFSAISRDSAVYTLVSFQTDSIQRLQAPIRIIGEADCTVQWTLTDSIFLRSKLPLTMLDSARSESPKLATDTGLATLQQQFNYWALVIGFAMVSLMMLVLYGLLGRTTIRQWKLYQLKRQHLRFLNEYNRLSRTINSYTAAEAANQAVIMWKSYLERLDAQPYTSMTTPELAEQMNDNRITDALREADRMIYGGAFSSQSQPALRLLGEVATQAYHRCRARLAGVADAKITTISQSAETPSIS